MARLVLLRLLESYFRRWYIYPLPMIFLVGISLSSAMLAKPTTVARGAIYVQQQSLVASLTSVQNPANPFVTPAQATLDELNELLQTDSFVRAIIKQTDLESSMNQGTVVTSRLIDRTRKAITVQPLGNNLVQVTAVYEEGPLAEQIAKALIDSYVQWKINADREESTAAQAFFENLVQSYQADLQKTEQAQQAWLTDHPDPVRGGDRPTTEQVQMAQLQAAVNDANTRLTNAVDKLDSAKLALAQAESKAQQTYLTVDAPHPPATAASTKKKLVINLAVMAVAGLILGVVSVGGAALLDSSYRFPVDVQNSLSLPVLAVVPTAARPGKGASRKAGYQGREATK